MLPDLGYLDYCPRCITIENASERWAKVLRFTIKSKLVGVHICLVTSSKWYLTECRDAVVPWWNAECCCRAYRPDSSTVTEYETDDINDKIETACRYHDGIAEWCLSPQLYQMPFNTHKSPPWSKRHVENGGCAYGSELFQE